MIEKEWTVVRGFGGHWLAGTHETHPRYPGCEVYSVSAANNAAAIKKAQALRRAARRKAATEKEPT